MSTVHRNGSMTNGQGPVLGSGSASGRDSGRDSGLGGGGLVTRIDAHCHSRASDKPVSKAVGVFGVPECYSEPEAVYAQARARGMDLVTITDHDTIKGALELHERRFPGFVIGQEVSVKFPEDGCLLHVLVWGLSPEQDEQISRLRLREDVYEFASWVREQRLAHSAAHPLYIQNGRLTRWHVERAVLLFRGIETLNGAHSDQLNRAMGRFVDGLTPERVAALAERHRLTPVWPEAWRKVRTGGSDDHALLNVGRSWTELATPGGKVTDAREFFRRAFDLVSEGDEAVARAGGVGGHSALLAHQISTVTANYYGRSLFERRSPVGKYISAKLLRFFGVAVRAPSKKKVAAYKVAQRMWLGKKKKSLPIVRALRRELPVVLEKYPDLRGRLSPESWSDGAAVSQHERMADFVQDMVQALSRSMSEGAGKAFRRRDAGRIAEHLVSYGMLQLAQLPYLVSLFHQNKERPFLDRFEHEASAAGAGVSVLERPMKISLFTDTIADVNGVCRFIQNVAEAALTTGRDLEVITSTKLTPPAMPNIRNFAPAFATKMPKYDNLDLTLPPIMQILRHVDKHQPDVIHISTPGPVGCVGYLAAKMLRVPVLGVYHTDFPAYVDRLFDDHGMTKVCERFMRGFYKPFSAIFTRSDDYIRSLTALGLPGDRIVRLLPGFDNTVFHPRFKDLSIWPRLGVRPDSVKVLYCGRVSVEKNLPYLTGIWKSVRKRAQDAGVNAELVVVGDGPYRKQMAKELAGKGVHFLGFRHGEELSTIYASSDVFAFPSTTDTLGQVVMESQGSCLPVLVTDQGGPKEVVHDGVTGFVLGAEDTGAWVERLTQLVTDGELRRRMGRAAHVHMEQFSLRHSFEHFYKVHTEAWHEHLGRKGITPETAGAVDRAVDAGNADPARTPGEFVDAR